MSLDNPCKFFYSLFFNGNLREMFFGWVKCFFTVHFYIISSIIQRQVNIFQVLGGLDPTMFPAVSMAIGQ
jgi:hypothetical protein